MWTPPGCQAIRRRQDSHQIGAVVYIRPFRLEALIVRAKMDILRLKAIFIGGHMGLFGPSVPHYYNDFDQIRKAMFKWLPKGNVRSADDPAITRYVAALMDRLEQALKSKMGERAFIKSF